MKKQMIAGGLILGLLLSGCNGKQEKPLENETIHHQIGRYCQEERRKADGPNNVAAAYGDHVISKSQVEYLQKVRAAAEQPTMVTERQVVDEIVGNIIAQEEAERLGLSATQKEIDEMIESEKSVYAQYPEAKKMVDEFCAGAGMTLEMYYDNLLEQFPGLIARGKLRRYYGEQWCEKQKLPWEEHQHDRAVLEAIEK